MDAMPLVIGASVAVGVAIATALAGKRNAVLAPKIEQHLATHGPCNLRELADGIGMTGFSARGKVVMALNEMVMGKSVLVTEAPAGTPQLKKVDHIKYSLAPHT